MPALVNMNDPDAPARITPVSHTPVSEVEVWLKASRFVHVTESPTLIVIDAGAKAEFWIDTALVAAYATSGRASIAHDASSVEIQRRTARRVAILITTCRS